MLNILDFIDNLALMIYKSLARKPLVFTIVLIFSLSLWFLLTFIFPNSASIVISLFVIVLSIFAETASFYYNQIIKNGLEPALNDAIANIAKAKKNAIFINEISGNILFGKNPLPYALKRLFVKDFEGIYEIDVQNIQVDANWIFLIGENGFGKTTILRAITIVLWLENNESGYSISNLDSQIGIEYLSEHNSYTKNLWDELEIKENNLFPHFACYGPSRLQPQNDQTQNDISKKSSTTYSLFNSDGILLNIEYSMVIWYLKEDPKFEAVKGVFKKLIPYLADIQITEDEKVLYIEKEPDEEGQAYKAVNFNQLASGFRSLILMVGDMMIRLYKSQPHIKEPSELAGIVIIDELDLHWHPKMQREIPFLLTSIFPKVQFIASTHSLVPLLGAPENSVLLKVNRTKEAGITVEKVGIDFAALSADTMLRDIFDLENYMSDAKIKAWDKFIELKGLIHFEKDEAKKQVHWKELERIADKYQFEL